MYEQRDRGRAGEGRSDEDALARGLEEAGLLEPEIDAFLAYSRELERELAPIAPPRVTRRAPWLLLAAAALLLAAGGALALLLGERGALLREMERVRAEREQLAREARDAELQRARLAGELASAQQDMSRRLADAKAAQSELVRYFQGRLLEHAAMGDRRALGAASYLSDMARDLPARVASGDFRDAWSRLVPPLDPMGFSPSAYDDLELASHWPTPLTR